VYGTSLLGVDRVEVTGSGFVGADAVRQAAAVPSGAPLASVDLGAIRSRVEHLVGVRTAEVHRDWPSTLVIEVTPRTAVATVPSGKSYELVDAGGVVFRTVSDPPDVPSIRLSAPGPDDPSTRAAISVLLSLPSGIRDQLVSMSATSPASVTLSLHGGKKVIWGDDTDNAAKGRVATSLLKRPGSVIDVSAPNVVTVR
jgi:cell division protein FtsQ